MLGHLTEDSRLYILYSDVIYLGKTLILVRNDGDKYYTELHPTTFKPIGILNMKIKSVKVYRADEYGSVLMAKLQGDLHSIEVEVGFRGMLRVVA